MEYKVTKTEYSTRRRLEENIIEEVNKTCVTYRVTIKNKKRGIDVNEMFKNYDDAVKFKNEVLALSEQKILQNLKIELEIKTYPYNLIQMIGLEPEYVIETFDARLKQLIKEGFFSKREVQVLEGRFMTDSFKTLEVVSKELGLTRERVRQIEIEIIKLLKFRKNYFLLGEYEHPEEIVKRHIEEEIKRQQTLWTYESARKYIEEHDEEVRNSPQYIRNCSIDKLPFSVRAYNCLRRAGIKTVQDIVDFKVDGLMKVRNLGKKSLNEIVSVLAKRNVIIPDEGGILK